MYSAHEPGASSCSAVIRTQFDIKTFYSRGRALAFSGHCHSRFSLPPPACRHFLPAIVQPPILLGLLTNPPRQDIVVPLREILHAAEFRRVIDGGHDCVHSHGEIKWTAGPAARG